VELLESGLIEMGKNLRNTVVNSKNVLRMAGPVTERLTLLEKRYSSVMVHQTYFKILDEWMQCMFGKDLFRFRIVSIVD